MIPKRDRHAPPLRRQPETVFRADRPGHSYIVYGPLANGCTSILYEGAPDYPDKDRWWDIAERYKCTVFYTAPTAIRACIKWGREFPRHNPTGRRPFVVFRSESP